MSGTFIEVKAKGLPDIQKALQTLSSVEIDDMLNVIGEALRDDLLVRFEQGVAPDGTPWQASQRALNTGDKTLIDTAILRDSFSYEVTGDELMFGSGETYAAIHQFGGKAGRNKNVELPARPMIGLEAKQLGIIRQEAHKFMKMYLP